jgi:hypothetical protein
MPKESSGGGPPQSIRFVLTFAGGEVRLLARQRVGMTAPASDAVEEAGRQTGFWYELRSPDERTLYRRVAEHPAGAEFPTDDPERPLARQEAPDATGVLVVVVPEIEQAERLVLVGAPAGAKAERAAAREIASFPLHGSDHQATPEGPGQGGGEAS